MIEEITATPPRTAEGTTASERDDAAKGLLAASSRDRDFDASRRRQLTADAALLLVTLIWGSTFVMVKNAVASFPVFSFLALRFTFAALALLPFVVLRQRNARTHVLGSRAAPPPLLPSSPLLLRAAAPVLLGVALFAGYAFQTAGLHLTTPAKAGFITGLSVVIVPLFAALILRQPPARNAWLGVGLAVLGLAFLTLQPGLQVAPGDLLVLACAFAFAAHILLTGYFAPRYDPLRLTLGSIITVAILSGAAALIFDRPLDPAALDAQRPVCGRVYRCAGDLGRVRPSDFSATVHHRDPHRADLRRRAGLRRAVQLPADRRGAGAETGARLSSDSCGDDRGGDEAGNVTRES